MLEKNKRCNLQLFADDGVSAGASVSAGTGESVVTNSAETSQPATDTNAAKSTEDAVRTDADISSAFDNLIKGEYKEEYEKRFNSALSKRLNSSKKKISEYEKQISSYAPIFQKLAVKYGKEPEDVEGILNSIQSDDSYYDDYAVENGLTTEQARLVLDAKEITRQNNIRREQEDKAREFNERFNGWVAQADALKQKFPSFDFNEESKNEQFRRFLNLGISVEDAYTIIHREELMSNAMAFSAQQTKKEVAETIRSGKERPVENGVNMSQASAVKDTMLNLSREEERKIERAIKSGARVTPENFRDFL